MDFHHRCIGSLHSWLREARIKKQGNFQITGRNKIVYIRLVVLFTTLEDSDVTPCERLQHRKDCRRLVSVNKSICKEKLECFALRFKPFNCASREDDCSSWYKKRSHNDVLRSGARQIPDSNHNRDQGHPRIIAEATSTASSREAGKKAAHILYVRRLVARQDPSRIYTDHEAGTSFQKDEDSECPCY